MSKKQKAVEATDTPLLPEPNEAYVDWTGAAGKRTGYVLTMADAERIVRESASWPVPTYGGRDGAQRVAREAIEITGEQL